MHPEARLEQFIERDRIPHALLFVGTHLEEAIFPFAQKLLQTEKKHHPDFHQYYPEGKTGMHPISALRKLIEDVSLSPYEAKRKVFVVHDAERMLPPSGNALLKTLEEPSPHTILILATAHPEQLLPTLQSRCQTLTFSKERGKEEDVVDFLLGEKEAEQFEKLNEAFFEGVLLFYRDRLLLEIEGGEKFLTYPHKKEAIRKSPLLPLSHVEEAVKQVRLASERSIKPTTCLEALLIQLRKERI